jgi:NitT/TauT family transport system permease protein
MKESRSFKARRYYHYHRYHGALNHPVFRIHKFLTPFLLPLAIIFILSWAIGVPLLIWPSLSAVIPRVLAATLATLGRILIAYVLSVVAAVPLAVLITKSETAEKFFLPIVDILESVPILAFFPIIILLFIKSHFLEGAALFVLSVSMLWNILFALVGGLKLIPQAVNDVTEVYKIKGWLKLDKVIIPAMFPELVTGSILAVADGWNIIIVAEVLHTYVSGGTPALDLFGLGSLMVSASAGGDVPLFLVSLVSMIVVIAIINIFVWQKLLHLSSLYRFD